MATVEYRNISKSFGKVNVISDLSLSIAEGDFTVLLGPSGCGKTTLLRITAGLEAVTGGDLFIDDKRVNEVPPRDRDIAMVFQNYALYPTMKVFKNIGFSLEVAKLPKDEIKRKVEEVAAVLNLTEYLDRYPKELSGGQRQRVAMGRTMVRDAKVFLFDEPLSNLDAKLRAHMRVEIRQLHDRLKATTIYVTHDQIEAMSMADKIVLMHNGDVVQVGTPVELYDFPETKYVADFIGSPSMNFVEGEVVDDGDGLAFHSGHIHVKIGQRSEAKPGQKVVCGIRPTDVEVVESGAITGELMIIETMGADVQLHVSIEGHDFIAVVPRGATLNAGQEIHFNVESEKLHIFDSQTERRIS